MAIGVEVLVRPPRDTGVSERFEILLGMARNAGLVE
jgi:hypothetical protein